MVSVRPYKVTLFGATGYVGRLAAEYLANQTLPIDMRWAIAGRNRDRLTALRDDLATHGRQAPDILEADVADLTSLQALAAQSCVLASTVGPYISYGEPVVEACVAQGTDYVDLTGEPEFVDRVIAIYHGAAREKQLRIVNCCGFCSLPHDLGVLFTVTQLPKDGPIRVEGFVEAYSTFSGGSWHSAIQAFANWYDYIRARPHHKNPPHIRIRHVLGYLHYESDLGAWVCPLPNIDPHIVVRSACMLPEYGPDFSYAHYLQVHDFPELMIDIAGASAVFGLAQFSLTRQLLLALRQSGEGPSKAQRDKGFFCVTFIAETRRQRIMTKVSGQDPGYGEASKMLAESALCLALDRDELPEQFGVLTPAVAMGWPLIRRLLEQGLSFEVVALA